jgi:hypothetical protein
MSDVIAFAETRRIAQGPLADVAIAVKQVLEAGEAAPVLIFDGATSRPVEVDLRGTEAEIRARLAAPTEPEDATRGRGRPKLGVTAREVTLLPRHWDWLSSQPGGASATLRRLVEDARKTAPSGGSIREVREAVYRFATVMAGNAPGYEEAMRALFAGDAARFSAETAGWPGDVRAHTLTLAKTAFEN